MILFVNLTNIFSSIYFVSTDLSKTSEKQREKQNPYSKSLHSTKDIRYLSYISNRTLN